MAYTLVVVQSDSDQAQELADLFYSYGFDILAIGHSGKEAIELARKLKPNAILMDPFMPYYNCDEVAEILEPDTPQTVKITIADEACATIAERFLQNGGDLFLIRPLDLSACHDRVEKFLKIRKRNTAPPAERSVHYATIREMQLALKMPVSIQGFTYIQEATAMVLENPAALHHITSQVYAPIGIAHRSSAARVERCIRTAVEKTFERGDLELLQKHFFPAASDKGKISNKEFIGIFAELIRKEKDL